MRRTLVIALLGTVMAAAALTTAGAHAEGLHAGFGVRAITPVGPSPAGWDFTPGPNDVWGEPFTDSNGNKYYDPGEPFTDDPRNTLIDPQSAGKWDGCWTNAGFSGKGALGKYDDTWARAVVLSAGGQKVALVSLDVVGFFYEEIERARAELNAEHPNHGIDMLIVSSTHTHEACDTMGYWGNPPIVSDGKYPVYQQFIRSQIVDAVAEANAKLEPALMKAATVRHEDIKDETGKIIRPVGLRDSRDPDVKDPYVQAAQFLRPGAGTVIGTLANWSNHPEALASGNRYISSDFPHGTRTQLESVAGGTAIYFSGSVGGLMTPLRVDMGTDPDTGFVYGTGDTKERAYYIGRLVADAALAALANAPAEDVPAIEIKSKEVFMTADNVALNTLNQIGIFDKPTFINGLPADRLGDQFKTQIVSVKAGPVRFQTVPGELFPEIEIGGYGRTNCPAGKSADTGRPHEPVIRNQFAEDHLFVLGLAQDELGYIVPGYDFWADGPDADAVASTRTPRPVVSGFGGLVDDDDPCGRGHYEESVSASSIMAPVVACTIAELAGRDPWNDRAAYPACSPENTTLAPRGIHPTP